MAMGILKGLGSLMRRGRGKNRKLTPEEVAQRRASEINEPVMSPATQMRNATMQKDLARINAMPGSTAMRAKQVGDETMGMIRDSVMKMDLPAAKKVETIKSAATAIRNATPAQLAQSNPAQLSMDIMKMVGAGGAGFIGGSMMEGAAREGRLPEMIQDSFLVRPEFRGMREPSQAVGKMDTGLVRDAVGEMMDATQMGYDMPDPEPGLEEFSFLSPEDLLLNELFRD